MIAKVIATWFYIGYLRPAPGTWGSLGALPFAWGLYLLGGPVGFALATCGLTLLGYWAIHVQTVGHADHDPSEIVVDEVVGQWLALWPVAFGAGHAGVDVLALYPGIVTAFLLFRLFDIWKPGPVGWADRRATAWGVMLDDIIAGLLAALGVIAVAAVAHGVMR